MADVATPQPKKRRGGIPRTVKIFLVLLLLGTVVSTWVFLERIYPIQQQLAVLKEEAAAFRALSASEVNAQTDDTVSWEELLGGEARGKVVRMRGLMGLKYQIVEGAQGGTLFIFPPDSDSVDTGPRALVYFVEGEPPEPASMIEVVGLVSTMDVKGSVSVISPEQLGVLESSIPGAIIIARRPAKTLSPPRQDLLPEEVRARQNRADAAP